MRYTSVDVIRLGVLWLVKSSPVNIYTILGRPLELLDVILLLWIVDALPDFPSWVSVFRVEELDVREWRCFLDFFIRHRVLLKSCIKSFFVLIQIDSFVPLLRITCTFPNTGTM